MRIYQLKILLPFIIGAIIYFIPCPPDLNPKGWQMLAIFIGTIMGFILKSLPMGAVALIGMLASCLCGLIDLNNEGFDSFGKSTIWLVVLVYFIARGFIKTNLAMRIAFKLDTSNNSHFMDILLKSKFVWNLKA